MTDYLSPAAIKAGRAQARMAEADARAILAKIEGE